MMRGHAAVEAETPIERLAGLFGLARLGRLPAQARVVVPALLDANEPVQTFPWEQGDIPALTTRVLRAGTRRRAASRRATSPGA